MKVFRRLISISLGVITLGGLLLCVACGESQTECNHEYEYTVISQATCEEKGEIEGVCKKCSNKIYNDVVELGHSYVNEECVRCGKIKDSVYAPDDSPFGLTLTDIFEKAQKRIEVESEDDFLAILDSTTLNNVYIKNDKMYFDVESGGYSFGFWWGLDKVELQVLSDISQNLLTIKVRRDVYGYNLQALYVDGTRKDIGYFTHCNEYVKLIERLAVNTSNELLVVFGDNRVVNVGELLDAPTTLDESVLVYEKITLEDAYMISGIIDESVENVVIPKTHKGKPVTIIKSGAFKYNEQIKTLTLGENIKWIETSSFLSCTNLQTVNLNKNLKKISYCAFKGCENISAVNYEGSFADKEEINILQLNESLTTPVWNCQG